MFKLPKLTYAYSALEPYIDAQTMEIHHGKHHQGYVDKLNQTLEGKPELFKKEIGELVSSLASLPKEVRMRVRRAGGGHFNHSLFWQVMGGKGDEPEGELMKAIKRDFGSLEELKRQFSEAAMGVFGSGWAWLSLGQGKLWICTTGNQDNCLMRDVVKCGCNRRGEGRPILTLDVWEHAYYLKYQNRRDEYVKNWWKVVSWKKVGENYNQAIR